MPSKAAAAATPSSSSSSKPKSKPRKKKEPQQSSRTTPSPQEHQPQQQPVPPPPPPQTTATSDTTLPRPTGNSSAQNDDPNPAPLISTNVAASTTKAGKSARKPIRKSKTSASTQGQTFPSAEIPHVQSTSNESASLASPPFITYPFGSVSEAMRNAADWASHFAASTEALQSSSLNASRISTPPIHLIPLKDSTPALVEATAGQEKAALDNLSGVKSKTSRARAKSVAKPAFPNGSPGSEVEVEDILDPVQTRGEGNHAETTPSRPKKTRASLGDLQSLSPYFTDKFEGPASTLAKKEMIAKKKASSQAKQHAAAQVRPAETQAGPLSIHGLPRSDSFFGLIQELVAPSVFRLLVVTCLLNQTRGKVAIPAFWSLLARYPDAVALSEANLEELSSMLQPLGLHNVRAKRLIEMSKKFVEAPPMEDKVFKSRAKDCPPTPINHYPGVGRYAVDSYRIFIADGGSQVGLGLKPAAPAAMKLAAELERRRTGNSDEVFDPDALEKAARDAEIAESLLRASASTQEDIPTRPTAFPKENAADEDQPEWKKVMPLDKELRAYLIWRWAKAGIEWDPLQGVVGQMERQALEVESDDGPVVEAVKTQKKRTSKTRKETDAQGDASPAAKKPVPTRKKPKSQDAANPPATVPSVDVASPSEPVIVDPDTVGAGSKKKASKTKKTEASRAAPSPEGVDQSGPEQSQGPPKKSRAPRQKKAQPAIPAPMVASSFSDEEDELATPPPPVVQKTSKAAPGDLASKQTAEAGQEFSTPPPQPKAGKRGKRKAQSEIGSATVSGGIDMITPSVGDQDVSKTPPVKKARATKRAAKEASSQQPEEEKVESATTAAASKPELVKGRKGKKDQGVATLASDDAKGAEPSEERTTSTSTYKKAATTPLQKRKDELGFRGGERDPEAELDGTAKTEDETEKQTQKKSRGKRKVSSAVAEAEKQAESVQAERNGSAPQVDAATRSSVEKASQQGSSTKELKQRHKKKPKLVSWEEEVGTAPASNSVTAPGVAGGTHANPAGSAKDGDGEGEGKRASSKKKSEDKKKKSSESGVKGKASADQKDVAKADVADLATEENQSTPTSKKREKKKDKKRKKGEGQDIEHGDPVGSAFQPATAENQQKDGFPSSADPPVKRKERREKGKMKSNLAEDGKGEGSQMTGEADLEGPRRKKAKAEPLPVSTPRKQAIEESEGQASGSAKKEKKERKERKKRKGSSKEN